MTKKCQSRSEQGWQSSACACCVSSSWASVLPQATRSQSSITCTSQHCVTYPTSCRCSDKDIVHWATWRASGLQVLSSAILKGSSLGDLQVTQATLECYLEKSWLNKIIKLLLLVTIVVTVAVVEVTVVVVVTLHAKLSGTVYCNRSCLWVCLCGSALLEPPCSVCVSWAFFSSY